MISMKGGKLLLAKHLHNQILKSKYVLKQYPKYKQQIYLQVCFDLSIYVILI